ncbi:uncharacterized protein LOC134208967 [Armigeres subalbatus]|uniref:uncharacterized protein LOC134208967 n=1 Tax=Armigeres subalbatus TaxID=124917 RepID=UPI002ED4C37E
MVRTIAETTIGLFYLLISMSMPMLSREFELESDKQLPTEENAWNTNCSCLRNTSDCSIEAIVNYGIVDSELPLKIDCTKNPIFNHHTLKVFANVRSFSLNGCRARGNELGLRYLQFPGLVDKLKLKNFCVEKWNGSIFRKFVNLKEIILENVHFKQITTMRSFDSMQKVEVLKMKNMQTENINAHIRDLFENLRELSLVNCSSLNLELIKLNRLEYLTMNNTLISDVSTMFLNFPMNLISFNATEIYSMKDSQIYLNESDQLRIQEIIFMRSNIDKLSVCNLRYIELLDFTQNHIDETCFEICNLPSLKTLCLARNKFTTLLASNVYKCENVSVIDLSFNRISYLNEDTFIEFEHLENLILSARPLGLIQPYPTETIVEPLSIPSKRKVLVATVAFGILLSHVIFMIYNRYKRNRFKPFYQRLPKEKNILPNVRETITTRTDSFYYEQPLQIRSESVSQIHNIYEEIPETVSNEPSYDHLQFHVFDIEDGNVLQV